MSTEVSFHVILVKIQAISHKGFLNEITYNLVMSSRMVVGFSRNLGKRSNPFSCFFKNSLQSSPLKVRVAREVLTSYEIHEVTERQGNDLTIE
jgi:hypothetical protein